MHIHKALWKMNCIWNVMISWLLLQFLVPAQLYIKTRTIKIYSNSSITCENDLKINITEVNIIRTSRQCISSDDECSLTEDVANMLKNDCDKKVTCTIDIHSFTTKQLKCLTDFGYFNLTYSCETKVGLCNFDTDWCDWLTQASNSNKFRWEREKIDKYNKIPPRDHTTASPNGCSAYIYSVQHDKKEKLNAQLYLGNVLSSEEQCISFWYYITDTNHVLEVFLDNQNIEDLHTHGVNHWHQARISIPASTSQDRNTYSIVLSVISGDSNTDGALAVDDIVLSNRDCSDVVYACNFETNSCYADYEPSIEKNDLHYSWIHHKCNRYTFTGPKTDHTTGSSVSGSCMYLDSAGATKGDIAYTKSSSMKVNRKSCLTFWYHMFGEDMGRLNVTLNTNHIWSEYGDKGDKWNIATIDIDPQDNFSFQFVGIYGSGGACDIAIDDILLLPGSCSGLSDHKNVCVDLDDVPPEKTYCPRGYLDFTNSSLIFEPEKTDLYCSEIYHQTKTRLRTDCRNRNDSQKCVIDLSTDKRSHPECFQLNELQILYTCEEFEDETTTFSTDSKSREASSSAVETTTISSFTTSREGSSAVRDEIVTLSTEMENSSDSTTDLVVGLVVGALLLVSFVIVIIFLMRRRTFNSNQREKTGDNLGENDYIGSQDIALPLTSNHSRHIQNTGLFNGSSDSSFHDNAHNNTVQHEYTNIGAVNGLVNNDVQVPTYTHRQDKTFADNHMPTDDEYAIVDHTAETRFNDKMDNRTGTADNYMVLDPTQTGFNRQIFSNTPIGYDFEHPVKDSENKIVDDDQYAISDGVYDHSGNNRHKESENNIYNHAVDTIYDSGSHKRNEEGREDTYDHFFGQTTEDDYDISTTT